MHKSKHMYETTHSSRNAVPIGMKAVCDNNPDDTFHLSKICKYESCLVFVEALKKKRRPVFKNLEMA